MAVEKPEENKAVDNGVDGLVAAGFATLTDDMVGRLSETASEALTVLDGVKRARLAEALPVLEALVSSGDLARLAHMARLLGAAEDALTDDLVTRLAALGSAAMTWLDRLQTVDVERLLGALPGLLAVVEAAQAEGLVDDAVRAMRTLRARMQAVPPPAGGLAGLWALARDRDNQRVMQALLIAARTVFDTRA